MVDDDTRLRELLKSFLSRSGLRVSTAANAAAARQQLDALDFDLIVLDVMMPGQTGLDFAGELRKTSDVPILMLTAMADPKDRIAGLEKGVKLERDLTDRQSQRFARAYRETGADSVEGFRKVLLGLLDPAERAIVDKRVRGNR